MTTIDVGPPDGIIDAEVVGRATLLRQAAAAKAKASATAGGKATRRGLLTGGRRLGRGLASFPRDLLAYWADLDGALDVAVAAPGDPTTKAKGQHEATQRHHRANVVGVALASLAWCTAGWTALAATASGPGGYGVVVGWWLTLIGVTGLASKGVWAGKHKEGWLWPTRLWGAVAVGAVALFVHLALGWSAAAMSGIWLAPVLGWLTWAASDGEVFGDGEDIEVRRVDEPSTRSANEPNAVRALAKGLGVKDADAASEVVIIGTPARDSRGIWVRTHFQLQSRAFAELERTTGTPTPMQSVAANLRRPANWVFVDRIGDESQGLLYVADSDPWPTDPIPWRGLSQLEHDVWAPTEIGVDMLTGRPVSIQTAATSDMCGASTGGGKTAWTRRELCMLIADEYVDPVIWDLKGDGALAAFKPMCSTYAAGDDPETMRSFTEWLTWFRDEESPRRKAIISDLVEARICPDVRLTREIARDPEYGIKLMVVVVDEAQEGCSDGRYGKEISKGLIYIAKQGRSIGVRLKIRTQKPTDDRTGIPSALNSMLPTRIAGRAEDYQVSKATLLTSKLRADLMPEGIKGLFYLRLPEGRTEKVIAEYVDANQSADYVQRVMEHRGLIVPGRERPTVEPEVPRILIEMQRLLSEPSRQGRMLTVEVAAAMKAYGIVEVTDADRVGAKTDEQICQEKVAAMVKPFDVVARPDKAAGNRAAYWLQREHRDLGEVGVDAAIARLRSGKPTGLRGASRGASRGSPTGVPARPNLRVM